MTLSGRFFITLLVVLHAAVGHALTGDEAIQRFQERMNSIGTMSGTISWTDAQSQTLTGSFKFMAPGRVYVKFSAPSGRIISSNGKRLWVFDSSSNVCGVQDLDKSGSGGIAALVNGYLAILASQGPSGYTVKLKNSDKHYSDITIVLDASFLLKKAVLMTKDGNGYSVTLSGVRTGEGMAPGLFDFSVPPNAQVVKNPLDVK